MAVAQKKGRRRPFSTESRAGSTRFRDHKTVFGRNRIGSGFGRMDIQPRGMTTPEFIALATDYDGTMARDGKVMPAVVIGLERVRDSGRKLLLVTGRLLDDLLEVFPEAT